MPTHLRCSNPECGEVLDRTFSAYSCPRCQDLLDVVVDPPKRSPAELKSLWRERRFSHDLLDRSGVWRFRDFLPEYPPETVVSIWEGNTPIIPGQKALAFGGVADIGFKHLGWNPTGCFKDLGMTVAITEARFRGKNIVACASTGNTAGSLAAYAARAGITARVYLPKGKVSMNKLAQSIDYGAEIVEIEGNFDDALNQVTSNPDSDVYLLNSVNPFRIEGQKTTMFELMEQLNWEPPDFLVLPGGNLGNSAAFGKAFDEMLSAGLITRMPRMVIVQAHGSNALVQTIHEGGKKLHVVDKPQTIASAICIGAPRSWKKALRALAHTNGMAIDVSDEEIMDAKRIIGEDGIGCEPASATTLAGIRQLVREKIMPRDSRVVAILTGHVLKDTEAILRSRDYKVQTTRQTAGVEA